MEPEVDEEIHPHSSPPNHGRISVTVAPLVPVAPPPPPPPPPHKSPSSAGAGARQGECWSEDATAVLIDAWGDRYLELGRGILRQKDWQDVADIVNRREDGTQTPKTDHQCKNRMDTVKKKYKVEKNKIADGGGPSKWRFYNELDDLIGFLVKTNSTPPSMDANDNHNMIDPKIPVGIPINRSSSIPQDRFQNKPSCNRLHFDLNDESEPENSEDTCDASPPKSNKRLRFQRISKNEGSSARHVLNNNKSDAGNDESSRNGENWGNSMRALSRAILKFGELYQQVETAKLQQLVELEKQRMKHARDLELQRMQCFLETQLNILQLKGRKHGTKDNEQGSFRKSDDGNGNNNDNNSNNNRE